MPLGALKGVGEKAMEALIAERERNGPFSSLEDFASRVDPSLLNRRQIESLAGAGAFDSLDRDRAALFAGAETILAHAASEHDQRTSGQAACSAQIPPRSRRSASSATSRGRWRSAWPPSARPSASISPPIRSRRSATCSPRTMSVATPASPSFASGRGSAPGASMAALVEDVRYRTSARGRRYMMATMSDPSGQFVATAFEDEVCAALETAAKSGQCGLLIGRARQTARRRASAGHRQALPAAR